jgi:hypothetical protein
MAFVTWQSARQADRTVAEATPAARVLMNELGPKVRTLLLYDANEGNRWYLSNWTLAQIGIGCLFFLMMLFGSRENAFVLAGILVMIGITALECFFVVPKIADLGRAVDFAPAGQPIAERNRLWVLDIAYYGLEAAKFVMGLVLAGGMVFSRRRSGRSRDSRREFDVVNKSNYGSVNR